MGNLAKPTNNEQLGYVKPKFETEVISCPFQTSPIKYTILRSFPVCSANMEIIDIVCRVSKLKW